jgi:hypothetical protein
VIFWDEWEMIPLLVKQSAGTLTFSDLFAQHNEHRILFPRVAMLTLGGLTRYNTVAEMFFSWSLICMTALLIFHAYQKRFPSSARARFLLTFLPVSILLFSFRQYESILWGFTNQIYLMTFGVVATFVLLDRSKKADSWFIFSVLSAVVASFSFLVGLAAWPVGLVQLSVSRRKGDPRMALWCLAGALITMSYFYGFVLALDHAHAVGFVDASVYFLILIGSPLSYGPLPFGAFAAASFGIVSLLISSLFVAEARRRRILGENRVWLSFILFACMFSGITALGRSGLELAQALSSRYTPITSLGIVGLYFLAISVLENHGSRSKKCYSCWGKKFGTRALPVLMIVWLMVPYAVGWQVGAITRNEREMGACVLMTYRTQSDENIRNYLYPDPSVVRERAPFLEQHKLNVFNEPVSNMSVVCSLPCSSFCDSGFQHLSCRLSRASFPSALGLDMATR